MKLSLKLVTGFGLFALSTGLWACDKPSTPEVPDPVTAVTPQMVKAKNDVKAYMDAANAFLACVKNDQKYNQMVDEMNKVAEDFNSAVRDFKERMASS
ncbi:hypothetical protein [Halioxenophilus sp. WMMB6]|uniref:hypothetical protein n=1 Tax=Halioxenophilus sp. WMMB6 TaxID=3073815 RepID=UPI00295E7CED|nr:hypothetical protein [Halioxenophilus sp. WMMB6]